MSAPPQPQVIRVDYPAGLVLISMAAIVLIAGIATLLDTGNVIWHNRYRTGIGIVSTLIGLVLLIGLIYRTKKLGVRVALGD